MKIKKFYRLIFTALIFCVLMSSYAFSAAPSVTIGMIGYLGATENEFQHAVDELNEILQVFSSTPYASPEHLEFLKILEAFHNNRHVIHFYYNLASMLMALNAGHVREISLPESTAKYMLKNNPEYIKLFSIFMPSSLSLGLRAEDTELCGELNRAIASMKEDGTLKALEEKYINAEKISETASFENFKGADKITIAVTGDMPPIDFVAADGKPAGYNTAVLSEIGRRLKKNIDIISIEAGARSSALTSGRADVIFWYRSTKGITIPDEFEVNGENPVNAVMRDATEGVILSEPYYEWKNTFIITK